MIVSSYRQARYPLLDAIFTQARIQFFALVPITLFWAPFILRFLAVFAIELLYNLGLALQGRRRNDTLVIAS